MAIDPSKLTQTELLQVINATPMGTVLTRSRLRRQMDAGAFQFGDGTHIHLMRYRTCLHARRKAKLREPRQPGLPPGGGVGGDGLGRQGRPAVGAPFRIFLDRSTADGAETLGDVLTGGRRRLWTGNALLEARVIELAQRDRSTGGISALTKGTQNPL
jgi:hypothetical protein